MKKRLSSRKTKKTKQVSTGSNSKVFGFFKRVLFAITTVVALIIALYFFVFPSILNRNLESKNILIISSRLDVYSNYIYLAHMSGNESKNTVLSIPAQQSVLVPGGYGEYPLQSVYQLLKIDKKDAQSTRALFSELFGVAIDEIITVDLHLNTMGESELSGFFLSEAFQDITRLQFREAYQTLNLHYQTKAVSLLTAEDLEALRKYRDRFVTVSGELHKHCSVAVVNASGETGLARRKAAIIENAGALVLRITDSPNQQDKTTIYYDSDPVDCRQLVSHISGIFSHEPEVLPIKELENAQQYRSKVVIIIGK